MSSHRYRTTTGGVTLFVGIAAQVVHPDIQPAENDRISERVWIDASQVADALRGTPLPLSTNEIRWLHFGLRKVAHRIEGVDQNVHIVVAVRALEIVLVDYVEETLAPAIAGWAAQAFGFAGPQVTVRTDNTTRQYTFEWHS